MKELDVVKLVAPLSDSIPVGSEGVIVHAYNDHHYCVEFCDDHGCTIECIDVPESKLELAFSYEKH
jgi:Domain of unknown function (DUF4926)